MDAESVLNLLRRKSRPDKAEFIKRYMKSNLKFLGVPNPECRRIAKSIHREDKERIPYDLIGQLWSTGNFEAMYVALYLLECYKKSYDDVAWRYVNGMAEGLENWAHCDQLCNLRAEFWQRKDFLAKLSGWSRSKSLWKRQSAAVSLLARGPVRIPFTFQDTIKVLEPMAYDGEYFVQKGVGWMLRVLYQQYHKETLDYLMKHKNMPRVALRIACEKMPVSEKSKVMEI